MQRPTFNIEVKSKQVVELLILATSILKLLLH
jgi:hypothetical protein